MPIRQITPRTAINNMVNRDSEKIIGQLIRFMSSVGERANNAMRDYSGKAYIDRTGNLRSSSGYILIMDGKVIKNGGFETVKGAKEGANEGKTFAESLTSKFPKGLVLVLVAGMDYSAAVSALDYNVMDSAQLVADRLVEQLKSKLK